MSQAIQTTKEILDKMGFSEAEIKEHVISGRTKIDIKVSDARVLIGERGAALVSFQHIVRRILSKKYARKGMSIISSGSRNIVIDGIGAREESGFLSVGSFSGAENYYVDIDINGYKMMREDVLKDFARNIAQKVRFQKRAVELEPMSSYDRRVIHLTLSSFSDLITESAGEGVGRHIIVRYRSFTDN